jgi:c-di-GMP-binding flagellar brake protein YcgR
MIERRRSRRTSMSDTKFANLVSRVAVEVLDISITGVFMQSRRPLPAGATGALRFFLDGEPVNTDVVIVREAKAEQDSATTYWSGAKFTDIAPQYRRMIERFTKQATRP